MRRRSNKHKEGRGRTNKGKAKKKQFIEVVDSSPSSEFDSPINLYQSDSWECPPTTRKRLIPNATMISSRRASLRSAKRQLTERPPLSRCSQPQKPTDEDSYTIYVHNLTNQQVRDPIVPSEMTITRNVQEMEEVQYHQAEKSMLNPMEGPETFEAEHMPLHQPLAMDLQASSHVEEGAGRIHRKSVSMAGPASIGLQLTELVNMCEYDDNEDDEVNSVRKDSTMDNDHGYKVKPEYMPMLRKIFSKHGDIAKNCTLVSIKYRSMLLEMVFDIIMELKDNDLSKIKEDCLQDMIALVNNEIKNMKVDIGWLQGRLEELLEAKLIMKQYRMLREKRESSRKAIENVKRELAECEAEKMSITTKFRVICEKEAACKEALARAKDEGDRVHETISCAIAKVSHFLDCSLVDGLL